MFQHRVLIGDYHGDLGLALAHPLYIAAGRLVAAIPIGDVATRLNFLSGLGMAVALANFAAVATLLTGRRWVGLATAAMLAVCHTVWWLSTIAEVYTWSVAGLTAEIWLLVHLIRRPRWGYVAALALVSGLGLCVHNFALLAMPVYGIVAIWLVVRRRLPPWSLATGGAALLIGASPYIAMTADLAIRTGDAAGAVRSALFGDYTEQVLNVAEVSKHMKANAALAAMNFANLLLPLAVIGWVAFRRRLGGPTAAALAALTVINVLFVLRYPVPDQFTFLLPTLTMVALAAAVGVAMLADASPRRRRIAAVACALSIISAPAFYAAAPSLAQAVSPAMVRPRALPFRNELRYWLVPWKHNERSAERFAQAALREAAPHGVILADATADDPLLVVQRRDDLARGVTVASDNEFFAAYRHDPAACRRTWGSRPLFLATFVLSRIAAPLVEDVKFDRPPDRILYRLRWKNAATSRPESLREAPANRKR